MEEQQIVISLNDFPEEVCAAETTDDQAAARCKVLKDEYCRRHPEVSPKMVYFHYRAVPVRRLP